MPTAQKKLLPCKLTFIKGDSGYDINRVKQRIAEFLVTSMNEIEKLFYIITDQSSKQCIQFCFFMKMKI